MPEKRIVVTTTTNSASSGTASTKEPVTKPVKVKLPLFEKENYMWMGIGAAIIALGMILMAGGKNATPNQFDYSVVYSTMRVTVAPIIILLGLLVEIYAIFKRPKAHQQ